MTELSKDVQNQFDLQLARILGALFILKQVLPIEETLDGSALQELITQTELFRDKFGEIPF